MNIGELRRNTQEFSSSTGQAYVQVDDVLYPIADVVLEPEGLIIVAVTDEDVPDEAQAMADRVAEERDERIARAAAANQRVEDQENEAEALRQAQRDADAARIEGAETHDEKVDATIEIATPPEGGEVHPLTEKARNNTRQQAKSPEYKADPELSDGSLHDEARAFPEEQGQQNAVVGEVTTTEDVSEALPAEDRDDVVPVSAEPIDEAEQESQDNGDHV